MNTNTNGKNAGPQPGNARMWTGSAENVFMNPGDETMQTTFDAVLDSVTNVRYEPTVAVRMETDGAGQTRVRRYASLPLGTANAGRGHRWHWAPDLYPDQELLHGHASPFAGEPGGALLRQRH